ncbi:hypothetical protein ANCCEY_06795 [Ancylostoma ceylanicum]|uniref:Uncharacterized protein n=1 Tax=Ancylostoma ceylanicum TaxID=53326 RepID=A0A0D6LQF5_9BILA|nr:hypothetical protein ANCCEY_06795 [Ancylostoma ceylanicum]
MRTTHRALERCLLKTSRYQQWHPGLRSTELREKSQLKDPLQYMQRMKHRWAGHLLRRSDDRWSLRVTEWLPRNKTRPLGRPPTRWADSFTKYFRQRGLPHWMQVARNRAVNMKGLYEKYGLKCERVDSKDFEANDRVVMAAKLTTTKNKMHSYVQAAMHDMDQNMADLNHPVGY